MTSKTSINNKIWVEKQQENALVEKVAQDFNIPFLIAKILLNREVEYHNISSFKNPKLKSLLPDPFVLTDMEIAVNLMVNTIYNKGNICILGDYDVDGITSTTLLVKYLKKLNINSNYYIPNRFEEGYGGSTKTIDSFIEQKISLLIMLDNGSSSFNEVAKLKDAGINVIIIDHHAIEPVPPKADAIVNPHKFNDESKLNYLCTVGLVFLFLIALNRKLRDSNYFATNNIKEPNLLEQLDLVALGTVCDMMPLKGINRPFVLQGLKVLGTNNANLGIRYLLGEDNLKEKIDVEILGFMLGPYINAASRMGKEEIAIKLLLSEDEIEAKRLAETLKNINKERQKEEEVIINHAVKNLEEIGIHDDFIFLGSKDWSSGLVGIIAGRIKEMHNKPTCIYSINTVNNTCTVSGRSVFGIDLGNIVIAAKQSNLLIKGGGHSQAVGFTFDLNNKEKIFDFFCERIIKQKSSNAITNTLEIDGVLSLSAANETFVKSLEELQPFGMGFQEPLFKINSVFIKNAKQIGSQRNHLSIEVTDGYKTIKGTVFKAIPSKLGDYLLKSDNALVNILAKLKSNFYKGKRYINLIIVDVEEIHKNNTCF